MDTSKIVGEKIKSLRESQSISIEQLAERSGLAVEQIERIENNIDLPSLAPPVSYTHLDIPEGYELLYCIAFGYPDETPAAKPRNAEKIKFID